MHKQRGMIDMGKTIYVIFGCSISQLGSNIDPNEILIQGDSYLWGPKGNGGN